MAPLIRVYCDDPEYSATWIDVDSRWTLGEHARLLEVADEEFWAFLRGKTAACHIQTADGGAIDDPAQITGAGLEEAFDALVAA